MGQGVLLASKGDLVTQGLRLCWASTNPYDLPGLEVAEAEG